MRSAIPQGGNICWNAYGKNGSNGYKNQPFTAVFHAQIVSNPVTRAILMRKPLEKGAFSLVESVGTVLEWVEERRLLWLFS